MTFEQYLKSCSSGEMSNVFYKGKEYPVTAIKKGDGYYGIGVNTGRGWTEWFHAESGTDNRKKYMSELSLTSGQAIDSTMNK